jgi:hypothetical protein
VVLLEPTVDQLCMVMRGYKVMASKLDPGAINPIVQAGQRVLETWQGEMINQAKKGVTDGSEADDKP